MKLKSESKYPFRRYDVILLQLIPPFVALLIKVLMLTCRCVRIEGIERERDAIFRSRGGAVYATWHQRMSYLFHFFGSRHVTIMISRSRDGEYAARLASWLGFKNVRGSSTRGGSRAMRELIKRIKEGGVGGILADGPQGPARLAKRGSVVIARNAEVPLIPILWGADRCWVFNSWDRYMVPKPFARIAIFFGEPIWIPLSAKRKELEEYRQLFEDRLNQGAKWCDKQFGHERPWRKVL
ncbi:MAG: lysophospholipid acyltransferase family protein [Thermodesulfobacteriota bacterium]|nr:lysophospholipid acyltransferase family protein [Thermodesulfobacteriota bacterium]